RDLLTDYHKFHFCENGQLSSSSPMGANRYARKHIARICISQCQHVLAGGESSGRCEASKELGAKRSRGSLWLKRRPRSTDFRCQSRYRVLGGRCRLKRAPEGIMVGNGIEQCKNSF